MSTPAEIEAEHHAWLARVSEVTGEPLDLEVITRVLGLAKRTAHGTARPLAPLAAYALGAAVGRGLDPDAVVRGIVGEGATSQPERGAREAP